MKYAIFLDNIETEVFETDEDSAVVKYEEEKSNYVGEDVYDKITLIRYEIVKEDDLNEENESIIKEDCL